MRRLHAVGVALLGALVSVCVADIIHVDDDAPADGDGTTWTTAFRYLQDALAVAGSGDEIRVAGGTYKPDESEYGHATPGDRRASFTLAPGTATYGGYAGLADPNAPDARDTALHASILSGDLTSNDDPNVGADPNDPLRADNSNHVVVFGPDAGTVALAGVTVTSGNATLTSGAGGIHANTWGLHTVTDCTIIKNSADGWGGGVYCGNQDTATFTDCDISDNSALGGGGIACIKNTALIGCRILRNRAGNHGGGGVLVSPQSATTIRDCTISDNVATYGGGVWCEEGAADIDGCAISDNTAEFEGGGLLFETATATVTDCEITGNVARDPNQWDSGYGGGVSVRDGAAAQHVDIVRCKIADNVARWGGGVSATSTANLTLVSCEVSGNAAEYQGGGAYCLGQAALGTALRAQNCLIADNTVHWSGGGLYGSGELDCCTVAGNSSAWYGGGLHLRGLCTNSIVAGNGAPYGPELATESYLVVSFCDVQGGESAAWAGSQGFIVWFTGTIFDDPLFVDPNAGDYRLSVDSPCIDAGSNAALPLDSLDLDGDGDTGEPIPFDLAGRPRVVRSTVDIGAHEVPFGDLNCDDRIDFGDINPFVRLLIDRAAYEAEYPDCPALYGDLSADGVVDFADINPFVAVLTGP